MRQSLRRQLRFLRRYAAANTVVMIVLATAAFREAPRPQRFAEVTVEQLDVVDANGRPLSVFIRVIRGLKT